MRILKSTNKWTVFFGVLTILSMAFIFYNSMQDAVASDERSLAIVAQVKPILDAGGRLTQKAFNDMVRAMAHLTEFAMLGVSLGGMIGSMRQWAKERLVRCVVPVVLFLAIADEILQYFTGRYSDVKDVALDVLGGIIGVMIVKMGIYIIRK